MFIIVFIFNTNLLIMYDKIKKCLQTLQIMDSETPVYSTVYRERWLAILYIFLKAKSEFYCFSRHLHCVGTDFVTTGTRVVKITG